MPGYKGMTSVRGPMTYSKDEIRSNYLANKKEILTVRSPKTSKISVAVWIDGTYERDERGFYKLDENNRLIYIPRSEEEMRKYENLVWASIGAEKGKKYKDREYIVRVENVQFDRTAEWLEAIARKEAEKRRKEMERRARLAIGIGAGFLAFAILMVILFMLMIRRKTLQEERLLREKELAAALKAKEEEEKEKEEFVAPPAAPPVEEEVAPPEVKEEVLPEVPPVEAVEEEEEPLESLAIDLAKTKPEVVARLLRTWIEEEEEVGVGG
jgi:flagellar biosynthesis/type III secretory pathway M-ring protein FliF/YscJ